MAGKLIYFSRHGETDWNVSQRIQGQIDIDINANGRAQADRNGDKLKSLIGKGAGFDFVASPLRRTRETMERIRARMGLDPYDYRTDPELMEVNFGDWQGYMLDDIAQERRDLVEARARDKWNFVPPGETAESYMMLADRVGDWLKHVKQPTVCVTHGGCIRTLFYLIEKMPGHEAANLSIPQDQLLRLENGRLTWL
ncbi:histidine phosphatase family protein [Phyllobacterium leguminum]|uniref:Putative phosphoglycerate mutase n=1 Tax=Phyllobacterium leguminum TaxID=314237 RepID=A0A318TFW5_9HYPH|nr:histidine phosphatase family protein [Phyllobacterium leguminum]PYE90582.1 putative phosphoglycerate mutase [Phyllobacterium leguminum]